MVFSAVAGTALPAAWWFAGLRWPVLLVGLSPRLALYGASGRLVREVAAGGFAAGQWLRKWDGRDRVGALAPSGLYFARLTAEGKAITSKLVLLR